MNSKVRNIQLMVFVVLFALLVTFYSQAYLVFNKNAIPNDSRETIVLIEHLRDNQLFKNDLFLIFQQWKVPLGIKLLYNVTNLFVEPIFVVKFLPFIICPLCAVFIYRIGVLVGNYRVGIICAFLMVLNAWYVVRLWPRSQGVWFEDGSAGDFHLLVLLIFLFYILKHEYLKSVIALIFQALFYPPLCLVSGIVYVLSGIHYQRKNIFPERNMKIWLFFLTGIVVISCLLAPKIFFRPAEIGDTVRLEEMKSMKEFYPGGFFPIFFPNLLLQITNAVSGINVTRPKIFFFFIALISVIILKRRRLQLPFELWSLLAGSFFMVWLSNMFMLKLFEPSRYARYCLPVFLIIFVGVNIDRIISRIRKSSQKKALIIGILFIVAFFLPGLQNYNNYERNQEFDSKLYDFLRALPKDVLLAGHPEVSDNIPFFSQKKVLLMQEAFCPHYKCFCAIMKKRTYDFFEAYYAGRLSIILDFCDRYNVDYFIVYKKHFSEAYLKTGKYYFSPFNEYISGILSDKVDNNFAVFAFSSQNIVFEDENYIVWKRN